MKKKLTRFLALIMALAIVLSLGACGKDNKETTTTETTVQGGDVGPDETATDGSPADETTTDGTTAEDGTTSEDGTTADGGATDAPVVPGKPEGNAQILAAYTEVMNKAKAEKPAFKKKEFQALPKDQSEFQKGKTLVNVMLSLAGFFMKEEDKAVVEQHNKGDDTRWFPVYKAPKGCLLTDTGAIKTASCVALPNGNYRLSIVLKDEINPEPYNEKTGQAPSNTGKMFSPLARSEIDSTLIENSNVNWAVKDASYELRYYNCTAELEYNPKTNRIVTLNQYMSVKISINEPTKVTGMSVVGSAVLVNTLKIWDFAY